MKERAFSYLCSLKDSNFHREHTPRELNICYHAEAREGQTLHLNWQMDEENQMLVDALRPDPQDGQMHRVFAAKMQF